MKQLIFKNNLGTAFAYKHEQEINFDYHINTFDFPTPHGHNDYWEFTILTEGAIDNYINGKKYSYTKNTLFYATTHDFHYFRKKSAEPIRYINLAVREDKITELLSYLSPDFAQSLINGRHSLILSTPTIYQIENIIYQIALLPSSNIKMKDNFLSSAILLVIQQLFVSKICLLQHNNTTELQQKMSEIMSNPDFLSYRVNDLCEKLGYSRMQLNRLFRISFNMTPHEYLISYKLNYSKNLLINTDIKILDIAMKTGYSNLSQFQINFKKNFKTTPGRFRKENRVLY